MDIRIAYSAPFFIAAVFILAVVVVWGVNGIYISGNSPVPNMDVGPLAFILVAMSMVWGFIHYDLLDTLPVAKAEIFNGLRDTTQKLMNITKYETKVYLDSQIIDIDKSSKPIDDIRRTLPNKMP